MKKFLSRVEAGLVRAVMNPKYRPVERDLAVKIARSVAVRWGLSSAVLAAVLEVIDRVLS